MSAQDQPTNDSAEEYAPLPIWEGQSVALRFFATFVSVLFHPIFIFAYMYVLLAWVNPHAFGKPHWHGVFEGDALGLYLRILLSMILLPLLAIALMRGLNMIRSIQLHEREDRIAPYIAVGLCYIVAFVQVNNVHTLPIHIKIYALGSTIALFGAFVMNLVTKVSAHTVGMGGMLAMTLMSVLSVSVTQERSLHIVPVVIVIAGLVGTSRRLLGAHEMNDLYGGYFIGFFSQFVAMRFLYNG